MATNSRVFLLVCVTMIIASIALSYNYRPYDDCKLGDCYETYDVGDVKDRNLILSEVDTFGHIRDLILVPPSQLPYNLSSTDFDKYFYESEFFYKKHLKSIFGETKNGFFVEAGALDGEYMSNTLWLEVELDWTGLLVEPDPMSYSRLQMKNRKAWIANSCFSVEKYPKVEVLSYAAKKVEIQDGNSTKIVLMKGNSFIKGSANSSWMHGTQDPVQIYNLTCYPMADFLRALNVTTIDLLSLDIETIEEQIIKNFDFSKFDIQTYICLAGLYILLFLTLLSKSFSISHRTEMVSMQEPDGFGNVFLLSEADTFGHIRIRDLILVPPSQFPYNLSSTNFDKYNHESEFFYKKHLRNIFGETKNGFFVEAGALDGEYMSNTIWLEVELGWTGLLVEPDPMSYSRLQMKNRKAWIANSCFSVEKYPKVEALSYAEKKAEIQDGNSTKVVLMRGNSFVKGSADSSRIIGEQDHVRTYNITCYPMADFLKALNVTTIDLLSLDIETIEEHIIKNFDFSQFDIQVIFIEWMFTETASWLMNFMENRGYSLIENTVSDFVFVKRGSKYEKIARKKNLYQPFKFFVYKVLN